MASNIQLPPLTQQTAPCGLGRRSNEMIAQALPMTMPDNTLPPLMGHLLDRGSLHGGNMERSPSLSSYTSSTSNYSSRSNTPGVLHSPAFPEREPYPSSTCATPTQAFTPLSRCSSCLEHGEHIPVAFGRACPECGTANHKQQHPSKTSRKKRTDRIQHSKRNQISSLVVKATKDKTEGGRRLDQTSLLGVTQRRLLGNNPSIIQEAAWKPLKSNNISTDSDTPLLYNKEHIIESAIDTIDHDNVIIEWAIDAFDTLQSEAGALRASTSSPVMFEAFINRLASGNWSAIMRHSCAHRGSKNFERPSGIVKKRHTKL